VIDNSDNQMATVINVPTYLDEWTFEYLITQWGQKSGYSDSVQINLRNTKFVDPFGMVGLIQLGRHLSLSGKRCFLHLPISEDVLKYMDRMDFFQYTKDLFQVEPEDLDIQDRFLRKRQSEVLLEITRVEKADDIHIIVERLRKRAENILNIHLHYSPVEIDSFVVALSEICQNVPEHSGDLGFVGIQKYFYGKSLKKNVVKIAVMDLGMGIKGSLSPKYGSCQNWSDLAAIHLALFKGCSRYDDPGRGQGLTNVRKWVQRWNGKMIIRSETAYMGIIPNWDSTPSERSSLSLFPGTQVSLILPEK
jgi:hypothetical protein